MALTTLTCQIPKEEKYPALTQAQGHEVMPVRGTEGQVCPWGQRTQLDAAPVPSEGGSTQH